MNLAKFMLGSMFLVLSFSTMAGVSMLGHEVVSNHLMIKGTTRYETKKPDEVPFTLDYYLEYWTLMDQAVINCEAKWRPGIDGVNKSILHKFSVTDPDDPDKIVKDVGLDYDLKENPPQIFDLHVLVPLAVINFKYNGYFLDCDPGAMAKSGSHYSFNTPGSPNWDRTFIYSPLSSPDHYKFSSYDRTQKVKVSNNGGHAVNERFFWLDEKHAKILAKSIRKIIEKNKKKKIYKEHYNSANPINTSDRFTDSQVIKVAFDLTDVYNYVSYKRFQGSDIPADKNRDQKSNSQRKSTAKNQTKGSDFWSGSAEKSTMKNSANDFWAGGGDAPTKTSNTQPNVNSAFWTGSDKAGDSAKAKARETSLAYAEWLKAKKFEITNHRLPTDNLKHGCKYIERQRACGYLEKDGKVFIPYKYQDAEDFAFGRAAVKVNGKWGFIDYRGKLVIDNQYDEIIKGFSDSGIAIVRKLKRTESVSGYQEARCSHKQERITGERYFYDEFEIDKYGKKVSQKVVHKDEWPEQEFYLCVN